MATNAHPAPVNKECALKIMIVGAPKAGNVWLKHLLSHIYGVPMVDVSGLEDPRDALNRPQFVTHQHILPRRDFLGWGERENVYFITMARHPGDLFLSLYHYVQNYAKAWRKAGILGQAPSHAMLGEALDSGIVLAYLAGPFFDECLGKTWHWMTSERARLIRYEDLHLHGQATLQSLSKDLGVVGNDQIARAIEKCRFQKMKRFAGRKMKQHFRGGRVGDWALHLQDRHLEAILKRHQPILEMLGYSLDPQTTATWIHPEKAPVSSALASFK